MRPARHVLAIALLAALTGSAFRGALADATSSGAADAGTPPTTAAIWKGKSGGFGVVWTSKELLARDGRGTLVFSAKSLAEKDFDDFDNCDATDSFAVISLVGPLLSIRQSEGATCAQAAHTSAYSSILTFDLSKPKSIPSLADFVPEAELRAALLGDGLVKKALAASGKPAPAKLSDLLAVLADNSTECEYRFETASLTHFAFHHLEGDKVAVRIGLPYGCEAARGTLTQLGLLVTVPAKLKAALEAAAARKQGFLMKDEKTVSKGRSTDFTAAAPAAAEPASLATDAGAQ